MAIQDESDKNTQNNGLESLRLAVQQGYSKYGMVDGVGDVFTDETGINTGSSTRQTYNSAGDYYNSFAAAVDTGTTFYDATANNYTSTLYGTAQVEVPSGVASDVDPYGGTEGIMLLAGNDRFAFPDDTYLALGTGSFTMKLKFKATTLTAGAHPLIAQINGTDAQFSFILQVFSGQVRFLWGNASGAYDPTKVISGGTVVTDTWYEVAVCRNGGTGRIDLFLDGTSVANITTADSFYNSTSSVWVGAYPSLSVNFDGRIADVQIWGGTALYTSAGYTKDASKPVVGTENVYISPVRGLDNMTLLSATQTASSAPTNARAVLLYDPVDASTLNTDCTLRVSRDGGSTFDTFTLTYEADYDANVQILSTNNLTLTQTSGTSMVWEFKNLNGKEQRLHGAYLQWA